MAKIPRNVSKILDSKIQEALDTFHRIQAQTPKYAVYTNDIFPTDGLSISVRTPGQRSSVGVRGITEEELSSKVIPPETKKRKSVECNGMELLSALMFLYNDITVENVFDRIRNISQNHRLISKHDDIIQYTTDLTHKKGMIPEYIPAFYRDIGIMGIRPEDIISVYLTGKYQTFPEIIALNSRVDHKTAKADVYVKAIDRMDVRTLEQASCVDVRGITDDGLPWKFIGLSVKQSQDATKTNYSIHKLLPSTIAEELTQIKRDFLVSKGFPEHDKTKRTEVNQLFYPETPEQPSNPYFQRILTEIDANNQTILDGILGPLFCRNIPYDMFEYDGDRIIQLNIDDESLSTARLEHHIPYYYDKKGELRQCAKMFFRLTVGEKHYRAELRWKGNIHAASPQFQIFAEK